MLGEDALESEVNKILPSPVSTNRQVGCLQGITHLLCEDRCHCMAYLLNFFF